MIKLVIGQKTWNQMGSVTEGFSNAKNPLDLILRRGGNDKQTRRTNQRQIAGRGELRNAE